MKIKKIFNNVVKKNKGLIFSKSNTFFCLYPIVCFTMNVSKNQNKCEKDENIGNLGNADSSTKSSHKEKKRLEKLAKYNAKIKNKENNTLIVNKGVTKTKKTIFNSETKFIDETVPGEKKILKSFEHPSLKSYNPVIVESSWNDWWIKKGFFTPRIEDVEKKDENNVFSIPSPPPNITGSLHIGHALTISIQDSLVRYYRMKQKITLFIPGFDHAGIATQSVVEKSLWKTEKKTRRDYTRESFLEKMWEWKDIYHKKIKDQVFKLGSSYDWSREAFTLSPELSNAVNEAFIILHEEGTIYRDLRLINWSCKLNTAISNLEVDNKLLTGRTLISVPNYDKKVEFGVLTFFKYKVEDSDEYITLATTRPETIFGDTGVAVHPDDPRYKHLHNKFVLHPFLNTKIPIITDSFAVDMEFGSGVVKITPAHDYNDFKTGKKHNLKILNIFTDSGLLNDNCGPEWLGMKRFDARYKVIEELKKLDLFVEQKNNEMTLPICSRSGDVIEPLLKPQWWINQKEMAKLALDAVKNKEIVINPKSSESEFYHWLNNIQDWCISRQLWWGHRCPVYFVSIKDGINDKLNNDQWISAKSFDEAYEKAKKKFDGLEFTLEQDEDVLDTWFSSALWPISTLGWPNKTKDLEFFSPMSLLETGWDILFFWVSRMIMFGIKFTNKVPFKEVFCHSLVRDHQGKKMSKSLGNVIDPLDLISGIQLNELHEKIKQSNLDPMEIQRAIQGQKLSFPKGIPECGADGLRFALCSYTSAGRDINLDILRVESFRKFCNKIYQATKFVLYKLGPNYIPTEIQNIEKRSLCEKWILHKLQHAYRDVNNGFEKREFNDVANIIYSIWYEFCDVYIENSKYLINDVNSETSILAKDTLYMCIEGLLRLSHPYMPFITEELWQRLPRKKNDLESIVISLYPVYSDKFCDERSFNTYELVLEITKSVRSLLSEFNIVKDAKVILKSSDPSTVALLSDQKDSITSLIKNFNSLTVVSNDESIPEGYFKKSLQNDVDVHLLLRGVVDIEMLISSLTKKLNNTLLVKKNLESCANDLFNSTGKNISGGDFEKLNQISNECKICKDTITFLKNL